jgi:hypothetical protein
LVGKPEGKRPLARLGHKLEDSIKTDLKEIGWECMDLINIVQGGNKQRGLVNTVMNLRVP